MKGSGDYSIGKDVGSMLGDFAEKSFRAMLGSGDYTTGANFDVDQNNILSPSQPVVGGMLSMNRSPREVEGAVNVRHREYLGDVFTGALTTPILDNFILEPTQPKTFPWLSRLASSFEQWVPHGIVFEFVPTSGNAVSSTNASLGSVSMATQYDISSGPFLTKTQLLNHYFASSASPATGQTHPIECALDERPTPVLYTLFGIPRSAFFQPEPQLYILGNTTIFSVGSQSIYTAGELWITYDISLLKPRVATVPLGQMSLASIFAEVESMDPDKRPNLSKLVQQRYQEAAYAVAEEKKDEDDREREDALAVYQARARPFPPPPSPLPHHL